jgi:hypothetical protein
MVWEVSDAQYFQEVMPVETGRWGVLGVGLRLPMNSRENARRNLQRAEADKIRSAVGTRSTVHKGYINVVTMVPLLRATAKLSHVFWLTPGVRCPDWLIF